MSAPDFDWSAEGNSDVVLRAYGSIAVHDNPFGDVVIRQERNALEDEDQFIVVPAHDAELVAQAIIEKAREIKRGDIPPAKPTPERLALPAPAPAPPSRTGTKQQGDLLSRTGATNG
jgi:hypothetical protein